MLEQEFSPFFSFDILIRIWGAFSSFCQLVVCWYMHCNASPSGFTMLNITHSEWTKLRSDDIRCLANYFQNSLSYSECGIYGITDLLIVASTHRLIALLAFGKIDTASSSRSYCWNTFNICHSVSRNNRDNHSISCVTDCSFVQISNHINLFRHRKFNHSFSDNIVFDCHSTKYYQVFSNVYHT